MTYELEIQIEELRAELRNAVDGVEHLQIQAELAAAERQHAAEKSEFEAVQNAEPPY
ncbi:hypothetical protein [Neorhizobium sp. NCHU2750]|uniref:hypothetical protein n=1 Tax=Neorhizobium sp. NCHU2750 TaxID=1825976 RepID=UPI000EB700C5|nr:hypothetical protein NCHU2750_59070 [Neorhizobium sp. NCHU2750]